VTTDAGLRETFGGAWQGLTQGEITAADQPAYDAWRAGPPGSRPPGGESREELGDRACAALYRALARLGPAGTVIAVTHGGTARALICRLLGLPVEHWPAIGGLANCSWSILAPVSPRASSASGGEWTLVEHNAGTLPEPVLAEEG